MTATEYRIKVIAAWRVGCIEREYVGKHRKP